MPWQGVAAIAVPLLFFVALGSTCWAWGESWLRLFAGREAGAGNDGPQSIERWALAATLGVGVFAQGVFVLGLLDRLDGSHLLGYVVLGHLLAAFSGVWRTATRVLRRAAAFAAASLPTILLALYPPTGFDATVYHLPYATRFLDLGGLAFLPELRFPIFPQLAEMAFVPAILSVGDVGAQLCQALCLLLGGGVVYAWGRERCNEAAGRLCAALWFGLPLAVWIGAQAYVDVELALFVVAGAAALDRGRPGVAGLLLGFAVATKYLGLFFFAAGFVLLARPLWSRRGSWRAVGKRWTWLAATALATAGPWYVRQVVLTGNPLFPFYTGLFGDNPWGAAHGVALSGVSKLGGLLTLPWDGVFRRARFHFEAPLSPWYLILLPLVFLLLWRKKRLRRRSGAEQEGDQGVRWMVVVACYGAFWLTTQGEIRFWLPALPLLHLPIALALHSLWPARRRLLAGISLLLLAPGWLYGVYKLVELGPPPVSRASRSAFLAERVPGYDAIDQFNRIASPGDGVYGLHVERLRHYTQGRFVGDWFGPDRYREIAPLTMRPRALHRYLEGRGLRYLLLRTSQQGLPRLRASAEFAVVYEDAGFALLEVRDTTFDL